MEQFFGEASQNKKGVFLDPAHRMAYRPTAIRSGEGIGFQDIGSSFGPSKGIVTYGKASKGKSKPTVPPKLRKTPPRVSPDDSDDELLLSSQASNTATSPKRVEKGKKLDIPDSEETICVDGRVLVAHPNYKPSSLHATKSIRFKKTKKALPGDVSAEVPLPSSLTDSQDLFEPISVDVGFGDSSAQTPTGSSTEVQPSEATATRHQGPSTACPTADANGASTAPKVQETRPPPTRPRPKPRVVITAKCSAPRKRDKSPESTPRPASSKRGVCELSEPPINRTSNSTIKKPFPLAPRREFPLPLQAKEKVSDGASGGDVSPKKKKTAMSCFPAPSPLKTNPVSRESTFPSLSPLSSQKSKGKARAESPDGSRVAPIVKVEKLPGPKLQPFPMSPDALAGIDRRSRSPDLCSPRSAKRASSDSSSAEHCRMAKKRKDSVSVTLDTSGYLNETIADDSIDLGYSRDPSKICPYCDEDLPSYPTPFFQHLLAMARKKSVSDLRPRNRRGLKAPLAIYISVCQRHRFELHQLPIATKKGWPKTIDFAKVPTRVKKMKKELEAVILDSDNVSDAEDITNDPGPRGPRSKSVFWQEVKKEVKKRGSRTVVGVKGQFASFEKAQPGYYGEQGSVIIHQTLFDLFPPSTFDASLISPLTPTEFIQRILVPEAAVRLIAQDMSVDVTGAIATLRESAQYGVAMFPDTGENKRKGADIDDDEMDVADQIVMERARIRRKELAEEEKVEKEMLEEERAAQRARARESRREKARARAQQVRESKAGVEGGETEDVVCTSEPSEAETHTTGRRRKPKDGGSESDAMSIDSLTSKRSVRKATSQANGSDGHPKRKVVQPRDRGANSHVHGVPLGRKVEKPFGFSSGFFELSSDGEDESTPRPAKLRTTTVGSGLGHSGGCILPLQMARNRPDADSSGVWSRNMRTVVPDTSDSDSSDTSQRLNRPRVRKGRPRKNTDNVTDWLWSQSSQ